MRPVSAFVIAAFASLAAGRVAAPPQPAPRIERTELAHAGTNGVHAFRIPALEVTKGGTLVAAYDARLHSARDLPNVIDIVVRLSHDDGRHWSAPRFVTHPVDGAGTGDASLLVDRKTGRVFLFYNYGPPGIGFFQSARGLDSARTLHPRYLWSDDDGRTWLGPRDLLDAIKQPGWYGLFTSSGHGVQLRVGAYKGRLLQPLVYKGADRRLHATDIYSDDNGATWHDGASIGIDIDESKAVRLADSDVLQDIRSENPATRAREIAISRDGGVHFDAPRPDPQRPDPHDNADLIRVDPAAPATTPGAHWLLASNTANPDHRRNLTLRLSCDDGRTWAASRVLDPGPSMYSVMARLPDGSFGIVWEDGAGSLEYARFNLAWVARGAPCV